MQVARKVSYTPYENESGRFWLRIGGRTINFIMTKEKRKENGTGQNAEPLKGPFRKGVWIGFGTKKFKQNEAESEDDLKETSWADEKGLDMK